MGDVSSTLRLFLRVSSSACLKDPKASDSFTTVEIGYGNGITGNNCDSCGSNTPHGAYSPNPPLLCYITSRSMRYRLLPKTCLVPPEPGLMQLRDTAQSPYGPEWCSNWPEPPKSGAKLWVGIDQFQHQTHPDGASRIQSTSGICHAEHKRRR
jgi:hypothetical protein